MQSNSLLQPNDHHPQQPHPPHSPPHQQQQQQQQQEEELFVPLHPPPPPLLLSDSIRTFNRMMELCLKNCWEGTLGSLKGEKELKFHTDTATKEINDNQELGKWIALDVGGKTVHLLRSN